MNGRAAVLATVLVVGCACSPGPQKTDRAEAPARLAGVESTAETRAIETGRRFLRDHVAGGRVVRSEHGGDTVSEGQAYGMLIAVGIHDRESFDAIWQWTKDNLQRADGLLSWSWADGEVVDPMPAADADLDAAHALALAAGEFGDPSLAVEALRIARAVLAHEVVQGSQGPVLVAGPWAVDGRWVNPSYASPTAFAALDELSDDPAWETLDDGGRRVVQHGTATSDLPPDWAVLTADGVEPRGAPTGGGPQHGYDAGRVAVRWAVDCDAAGPRLAAAMRDEYQRAAESDGRPPAVLGLDGTAISDHGSPLLTVAHAASALASGDRAASTELLEEAEAQSDRHPSYYGDAWVALGQLWLTTDRLGGCAADRPLSSAPAPSPSSRGGP